VMFAAAATVQVPLTRRRGALKMPDGPDAALQGAYYLLNGPLEEAIFRGLIQGGLGALVGAPAGFLAGTATYVLYHRLGGWTWPDVAATALVGIPLGLAFWFLPGPPSLLGVSLAHVGATCGFLGPGPPLLRKLRLLSPPAPGGCWPWQGWRPSSASSTARPCRWRCPRSATTSRRRWASSPTWA